MFDLKEVGVLTVMTAVFLNCHVTYSKLAEKKIVYINHGWYMLSPY